MKYEYRKGDKLKFIDKSEWANAKYGDIMICEKDVSTNYDDVEVQVTDASGRKGIYYYAKRFEKVNGKKYIPKKPTHIVVWEEDRDPCRFFTSEKEAKDFVKELSEKSSVVKDSIVICEIKSCNAVKISKSLRYSPYKI